MPIPFAVTLYVFRHEVFSIRDAVPGGYGGVIKTSKQEVPVNNGFETTNLVQVSLTSL
jgi:hypothetical protein